MSPVQNVNYVPGCTGLKKRHLNVLPGQVSNLTLTNRPEIREIATPSNSEAR
jgi:hypothetical protein